jgi:hypothetical protein
MDMAASVVVAFLGVALFSLLVFVSVLVALVVVVPIVSVVSHW